MFGKSIKGRRNSNQDRIYFEQSGDCFMMVVADGVGGNYGGEFASRIVITQCKKQFGKFIENPDPFMFKKHVNAIYLDSINVMSKISQRNKKFQNMSTTLTIVIGTKEKYIVGNIGDSRTCLLKNTNLQQISVDHSYLQEYKDKYPDEEIPETLKQQLGRVITRSVCTKEEVLDIFPMDSYFYILENNDALLLCSDGLILDELLVDENYISSLPKKSEKEFVKRIIGDAFAKGSMDNISAVYGLFEKLQDS